MRLVGTGFLALQGGDGIGKEVLAVGKSLLEAIRERRGLDLELVELDLGADRFLRDGTTFPEADQKFVREECDAVLLGALGDPRVPDLNYARDTTSVHVPIIWRSTNFSRTISR